MTGRWTWASPLAGVLFVASVVASNIVSGGIPKTTETPTKVISFYAAHQRSEQASAILTTLAIVFGLFFFGELRAYLRRNAAVEQLTFVGFAGAVLFAAAGCVNAGVQWALADAPTRLMPAAAQALNELSQDQLATGFFGAGLAVLMLGFGMAMIRSRLMPAWLGLVSVVLGVVAVAGPLVFLVFVAAAPWVLVTSALLYLRNRDAAVNGAT